MKNFITHLSRLALLILLLSVMSARSQTQTDPYRIINHTNCHVDVSWEMYSCSTCSPCNNGSSTIPGLSVLTLAASDFSPCGGSTSNILVTITDIGGVSLGSPITVDAVSATAPLSGGASGCYGANGQVSWSNTNCMINP